MLRRPIKQIRRQNFPEREPRKRFKIVTDGVETEKQYFTDLNRIAYDIIDVRAKDEDVDKLVRQAIKYKNDGDYDEVCVVCDIDERLGNRETMRTLEESLQLASDNGIEVYLSNESFDIWMLAHIEKRIPSIAQNRVQAQDMLCRENIMTGANEKRMQAKFITPATIKQACDECDRLRKAYGSDVLLATGPVTDVDKLVGKIKIQEA